MNKHRYLYKALIILISGMVITVPLVIDSFLGNYKSISTFVIVLSAIIQFIFIKSILKLIDSHSRINKKVFIRIGNILDERSNIYDETGKIIGKEVGLSVYETVKDINTEDYRIVLPKGLKRSQALTLLRLIDDYDNKKRNAYLLEGDIVGKGLDNEYLIKNALIIKILNENL